MTFCFQYCVTTDRKKKLAKKKKANLLGKRRSKASIDDSRVVSISCKIFISVKLWSYIRCLGTSSVGHVLHRLSLLPIIPTRNSGKTHKTKLGSRPYHQRDYLRQVDFTWTSVQFPLQFSLTNWSKLVSNKYRAPFTDTRHHRRPSKKFEDSCLVGNVNSSLPPDPLELCHLLLREDQFTPLVRDPPLLVLNKSSALSFVLCALFIAGGLRVSRTKGSAKNVPFSRHLCSNLVSQQCIPIKFQHLAVDSTAGACGNGLE